MSTSILLAQVNRVLENPAVQTVKLQSEAYYFSHLGLFKAISIFLSVFFIVCTIFFVIKTGWLALRIDRVQDVILKKNLPKKRSMRAWREIQRHFFAGSESDLKLALIEADKILYEALKLAGFKGENLGDILKELDDSKLPNLQEVWEAHKLRNRLAHETDFRLSRDTAERALAIYEQTFRDLGLLD